MQVHLSNSSAAPSLGGWLTDALNAGKKILSPGGGGSTVNVAAADTSWIMPVAGLGLATVVVLSLMRRPARR